MTFKEIALPLAAFGIPVFPLQAGNKEPVADMHFVQEATTDPAVIDAWNEKYPDSNVAMLSNRDGVCFLEWDIPNGMGAMCAEMNQQKPPAGWTRAQRSGRKFTHLIFTHTDRSRAIGNRSVNLPDACECSDQESKCCCVASKNKHHHHEWFSFRAHNKYLVGAGSLHPNGKYYETAWDVAPTPIPDWVCDWIEKHSEHQPDSSKPPKDARPVVEEFDFDDLAQHCGMSIMHDRVDNPYKLVDICVGVGRKHEHSTTTAFWWNGETVGWSCFAQGCPTLKAFQDGRAKSKLGSLLMFMAEQGNPYLGRIWADDTMEGFNVEEVPFDADIMLASVEVTPAGTQLPTIVVERVGSSSNDEETPSNPPPPPEVKDKSILTAMPENCMYGWLGDYAKSVNAPLGHAYTAALAIFAGQSVINSTRGGIRGQVYAGLIAPKHEGKTRTTDRLLDSINFHIGSTIVRKYPGSEHGLITALGGNKRKVKGEVEEEPDRTTKPFLMVLDELKWLFGKSDIKNSALPNALNDLFYHDYIGVTVKGVDGQCWPRLNLVGGLTAANPEDFSDTFGKATESGLYDRFIFSVAERGWEWDDEWEAAPVYRFPKAPITITKTIFTMKRDWERLDKKSRGRLGEIALRIAVITASANHESVITVECMRCALRYCEWQEAIRNRYLPSEMDDGDRDGKCQEAIVRAFRRYKPDGGWAKKKDLCIKANLYRHTAKRLNMTWEAMLKEGMLVEGQATAEGEDGHKVKKRSEFYRLADDWGDKPAG